MTTAQAQTTDFTKDILGRYICNGLDEALRSTDKTAMRPDGSPQSDAQPFDIIVIGGGSFGPVFAQHLFANDKTHSHRILVLEAGSLALPEHVQNLPPLGLNVPGPTETDPGRLREELWGLPWRTNIPGGFTGLAYCLGGRSLFFGGWSPRLLDTLNDTEMPRDRWPDALVTALNTTYFAQAAEQIGTDAANDFIDGALHRALRKQIFDGINANQVSDAIKPAELPLFLKDTDTVLPGVKELFKLEAPLAVQAKAASGLFPFNKFSAMPLLTKATRAASAASKQGVAYPDDVKKRLMVVPHCRVIRLNTDVQNGMGRVIGVEVETAIPICGDGNHVQKQRTTIPVPTHGKVIIALGTIESTRLALLSFTGIANAGQIGQNLMAHLRSNLTIRIPRTALAELGATPQALQASALFIKGRHTFGDGRKGYFHHQLTAAGLDKPSTDSEAELFKKIPDLDSLSVMNQANDQQIVITIRGIGETQGRNPGSRVTLNNEQDEVQAQRAFVELSLNAKDQELWNAMDRSADDVARVLAGGKEFEVLNSDGKWIKATAATDLSTIAPYTPRGQGGRRDGLGTTHHEAGSLALGSDHSTSVCNTDGRFHFVSNAYVAGPALFPTVGSPNPMLTGVALARRLADHLTVPPFTPDPGFTMLFDGASTAGWQMSTIKNQPGRDNPGTFLVVNGALESLPGTDLGLFWHTTPTPPNYILKLEWLRWREDDNSGIFVRFPHPDSKGYDNTAYIAIHFGFEVQIDQLARPDGAATHKTGAIYDLAGPIDPNNLPVKGVGEWNELEIQVQGQSYTVFLNGSQITHYVNTDPNRGATMPSFIGLQTHTGRVAFRKIQIKAT